jgi:hypothetical protein
MVPGIRLLVISLSCSSVMAHHAFVHLCRTCNATVQNHSSGSFDPVKFEEGGAGGESIMSCLEGPRDLKPSSQGAIIVLAFSLLF